MAFVVLIVLLPILWLAAAGELLVGTWGGKAGLAVLAVCFVGWVIEGAWKAIRPRRS